MKHDYSGRSNQIKDIIVNTLKSKSCPTQIEGFIFNKMTGVYKFTNPENKIYIGASKGIFKRIYHYKSPTRKLNTLFYDSLRKYGYDNHVFEIIEECALENLNERERYWQEFYNVLEDGLNMVLTKTKDKREVRSEEVRRKISTSNKGKVMSPEARMKISIWHTGKIISKESLEKRKLNMVYKKGWNHTQESKDKMSQKTKGILRPKWSGANNSFAKKIINIQTQEIFGCLKHAAESVGISSPSLINRLKGRVKNDTYLRYYEP